MALGRYFRCLRPLVGWVSSKNIWYFGLSMTTILYISFTGHPSRYLGPRRLLKVSASPSLVLILFVQVSTILTERLLIQKVKKKSLKRLLDLLNLNRDYLDWPNQA